MGMLISSGSFSLHVALLFHLDGPCVAFLAGKDLERSQTPALPGSVGGLGGLSPLSLSVPTCDVAPRACPRPQGTCQDGMLSSVRKCLMIVSHTPHAAVGFSAAGMVLSDGRGSIIILTTSRRKLSFKIYFY